jgi:GDPmannose 4,6-dehydratase
MQTNKQSLTALVTGAGGQDGSYLCELLLSLGYTVHGLLRHTSLDNTGRISHLKEHARFFLHFGDVTDSLLSLLKEVKPDEVYNLAALSFVESSFANPRAVLATNTAAVLELLESIRQAGGCIKLYQASTSEMYGDSPPPQNEKTAFKPRSPYAVSKLAAFWYVVNYREAYGLFAVNGILFNHESPRRGALFVTKKVCAKAVEIQRGQTSHISLGNLDAKRDWGHARDYVKAMWLMLQQSTPQDFVVSTGVSRSVREFVEEVFSCINLPLTWAGSGLDEVGLDSAGVVRVKVDARLFRPLEVDHLQGDATKARTELGWNPDTDFKQLVREMVSLEQSLAN